MDINRKEEPTQSNSAQNADLKYQQLALLKAFCAIPDSSPDESITRFSQALSTAIAQMNHNVELIKCFMSSQNNQNQCFIDRDLQFSQDICKLERQILNLERTILEKSNG